MQSEYFQEGSLRGCCILQCVVGRQCLFNTNRSVNTTLVSVYNYILMEVQSQCRYHVCVTIEVHDFDGSPNRRFQACVFIQLNIDGYGPPTCGGEWLWVQLGQSAYTKLNYTNEFSLLNTPSRGWESLLSTPCLRSL